MATKITLATVKGFIKKNNEIYIKVESNFDDMTDCCEKLNDEFSLIGTTSTNKENTFGISGAWFVLRGGDYFSAFENETYKGIEVYNCCGSFILAVKK